MQTSPVCRQASWSKQQIYGDTETWPAMTQEASLTLGLTISRSPRENRWSSGLHCLHNSKMFRVMVSIDSL